MDILLKSNNVYNIDCIKGIQLMQKQSMKIDVIVTSPPYNIGKNYNKYNDKKPRDEYLNWMENIAKESFKILSDNSSFFLNIGSKPTDLWIPFDLAERFRKYFSLQNVIHWIKSISISKEDMGNYPHINGDISVGHYQPVNSKRFLNSCHEYIFHFTKKGNVDLDKLGIGVSYQDKSNIDRWQKSSKDLRDRGNTWFIPYKTIHKSRPHPTVFPIQLPKMCLKLHGLNKINLVLDPFLGIGSTALACKKLGIDYIGFEIDPKYIDIFNENLNKLK